MPRGGTFKTGPAGLYNQHVFQIEDVKDVVRKKGPMSPVFLGLGGYAQLRRTGLKILI